MHVVKLTYFNKRGKFKYEGEYETSAVSMYRVFEEVDEMRARGGSMPGIISDGSEYHIRIDTDAPFGYPGLSVSP